MNTDYTLVTYTYDDARLLDGLLASVSGWTIPPARVVVVDDGSRPAYVCPAIAGLPPVDVLRHATNLGNTVTKNEGISAAGTTFILSIDCDIRLAPDWVARNLPSAADPGVGVAAGPLLVDSGEDLCSRYLKVFEADFTSIGDVEFLHGCVWLFRRAVWKQVGGFGGHEPRTRQDHAFCRRVRAAGLRLVSNPYAVGRQTRRMSPAAAVKRHWVWLGRGDLALLAGPGGLEGACYSFYHKLLERLPAVIEADPLLTYFELLFLGFAVQELVAASAAFGRDADAARYGFARALETFLEGFPEQLKRLRLDLAGLGRPLGGGEGGSGDEAFRQWWTEALAALAPLRGGVLPLLELRGMERLRREQSGYDFSFYEGLGSNSSR